MCIERAEPSFNCAGPYKGHDTTGGLKLPGIKIVIFQLLDHITQGDVWQLPAVLDGCQSHDLEEHIMVARLNEVPSGIQLKCTAAHESRFKLSWTSLCSIQLGQARVIQ